MCIRDRYRFALTAVCIVLTVYAGFSLLWGVNYYAESLSLIHI